MYEDFSKLLVWKKAHDFVLKIYKYTMDFPKTEQYGLTSQLRRAVISIPSNIVEGKAKGSNKEYNRFLLIARGSLEEVKYHVLLAKDLNYIEEIKYKELYRDMDEIGRLLGGLLKSIKQVN